MGEQDAEGGEGEDSSKEVNGVGIDGDEQASQERA